MHSFGAGTQMKTEEVFGKGNLNTAQFWEMDTRLMRRWNVDPKPNPSISNYAIFGGNPIMFSDILGDTIGVNWFRSTETSQVLQNEAHDVSNGIDDGVFIIAGHGSSVHMSYDFNGKQPGNAMDAKAVNMVMAAKSPEWKARMKDGKQIVLMLYACNTGSNEFYDSHLTRKLKLLSKHLHKKYQRLILM